MKRREFLYRTILAGGATKLGRWPVWALAASGTGASPVQRVLVTFKCHLDVGFSDTQASVMRKYFDQYFPLAIRTATARREAGQDRYVWTTGSWLLYEYLEQASAYDRGRMEQAIAAGDIAWHALPFSWQSEMLDRSMIEGCLGLSKSLDLRFGRKTTGAKMTDVPGHSRGIISPLAAGGVKLLDIGVNAASTPPDVPDIFVWKNPDGSSLIMLYHRHSYGSAVQIPGSDLAIAVEVGDDNTGPHSEDEIKKIYADLRQQFPGATITAANFSEVAEVIDQHRDKLPVVTQEIGDTWLYGVPSDPVKVARYREIARLRLEWVQQGHFAAGDATDCTLLRRLALAVEHTWGADTKRYLDYDHYLPRDVGQVLNQPGYKTMEQSWQEKRDDIDAAVAALPTALQQQGKGRLSGLRAVLPSKQDLSAHSAEEKIDSAHFVLALGPKTGAIATLRNKKTGREWASPDHPLALFTYQTLSASDYDDFLARYVRSKEWWAPRDFGKPNIRSFGAESRDWHPSMVSCWRGRTKDATRILAELKIDDPPSESKGCVAWPRIMYLELVLPDDEPVVRLTFSSFGKPPNRMPESMWLTFAPHTLEPNGWALEKVDQQVSPLDVVRGAGRSMHAVTQNVNYRDSRGSFQLTTLDAPVVALGKRSPLNFSEQLPDLQQGVHINLFNNAWGTNYIQWAGGDWVYRFTLSVG
jgi:Domain of unknown function (DUF5054)